MTDAITKLREPAALGAAVFAALSTLAAIVSLLFTSGGSFTDIAYSETGYLLSFPVAAAVAIAVYLANHVAPALAKARLVTLVSLVTVAAAALFGLVSFFAGFGADSSGTGKFTYFLSGAAGAVVIGLAGWYTWLTWQTHAAARPSAPAAPAPGGWNPGMPQQPQQPGPQQPGQPGPPPGGFGWKPGNANEQTAYIPPQSPAGPPQTLQAHQSPTGSFRVPPPQQQPGQAPQQPGPQHGQPGPQQSGPQHQQQPGQHQRPPQGGPGQTGAEATQMMPPVPSTIQDYAPDPQPWQPHGPGGGNVPQPPPTRPMNPGDGPTEAGEGPFGVGNWQ